MRLSDAASRLFGDQRRDQVPHLEPVITSVAAKAMDSLPPEHKIFDKHYCSVGGSVRRGTHLPGESDFDITLALSNTAWSGPYRTGEFEPSIRTSLSFYASLVGKTLANNQGVCDRLAQLFESTIAEVKDRLSTNPFVKEWPGAPLLAAKFRVADVTAVEVGIGDAAWHYAGLLYHDVWRRQLDELAPERRVLTVSHVLLAKRLVKNRNLYGSEGRLPNLTLNSRRIEQFVMQQALVGSPEPFVESCRRLAQTKSYAQALPLLAHPAEAFPRGITEAQLNVVKPASESLNNWKVFQKLAQDVVDERIDYASEV